MFEPLLIHNDNSILVEKVQKKLSLKLDQFDFGKSDLDTYITKEIIPLLQKQSFNILFIKDNLSQNYIELYGILLTYHIRLSHELGDKRFAPIVILSDLDGYILNKMESMSNILFTKNVFIGKNDISTYEYFQKIFDELVPFTNFHTEFLELINIEQPQDYLSHHSISNEWSIYKWANSLNAESKAIQATNEKIENMLYFKYLKAIHGNKDEQLNKKIIKTVKRGSVLLIDDEWEKGWKDIVAKIFDDVNIEFNCFEYDYKDKNKFNLIVQLNHKELRNQIENTDVVILDLRLTQVDHESDDIDSFTGIKILEKIHEINAGIQVIMLTATSKSTILEKLYEKKILGYIKKEHPEEKNMDTVENINKFISLVDKGLNEKYLKEIYITKDKILKLLEADIFSVYSIENDKYVEYWKLLKKEAEYIFNILNSNTANKYSYAMLSIARSLEAILSIFITERQYDNIYWDSEICIATKFEEKMIALMKKLGYEISNLNSFVRRRNSYMHSNASFKEVNKVEIEQWFNILLDVIIVIDNPPKYTPYIPKKPLSEMETITTKSGIRKKV